MTPALLGTLTVAGATVALVTALWTLRGAVLHALRDGWEDASW